MILPLSDFPHSAHPDHPKSRKNDKGRLEYCPFCKKPQFHRFLEEVNSTSHLPGSAGVLLQCNVCQACSLH